jgi:hypothetical protein
VPLRGRKLKEVDVLALEDVLLDRARLDHARRDRFPEGVPQVTHDSRIAGAFRQTQHQLDLAPAAERRRQELRAPSVLVADDVPNSSAGPPRERLARVIAPISSFQSTETVMRRNWSAASSVANQLR